MPPSVLISSDRADVESALASQPKFTDPQVKALYNWALRLVTALFNYVSYFLGDNADRHISLQNRVQGLEDKLQELQSSSIPTTIPQPTPQQPSHPSPRFRCKRCSAIGHDTKDCRTKDPVTVKKRVANNKKAKKLMDRDPPPSGPPMPISDSSVFFAPEGHPFDRYGKELYYNRSTSSYQAFTALAADAKELRRRKVQSTRDKRRRRATTNTTA